MSFETTVLLCKTGDYDKVRGSSEFAAADVVVKVDGEVFSITKNRPRGTLFNFTSNAPEIVLLALFPGCVIKNYVREAHAVNDENTNEVEPKTGELKNRAIISISPEFFLELLKEAKGDDNIICRTTECVFNLFPACGIKNVHIFRGKCPHYNPKLTYKDVSPGYEHDANSSPPMV